MDDLIFQVKQLKQCDLLTNKTVLNGVLFPLRMHSSFEEEEKEEESAEILHIHVF